MVYPLNQYPNGQIINEYIGYVISSPLATNTCITANVAQRLGLIATGKTNVHTANGQATQNTHIVNVSLPNNVIVEGVTVSEITALSGGCDVLIGMDIIGAGDFSVCNHNDATVVSFRIPSLHHIDYAKTPLLGHAAPVTLSQQVHKPSKKQSKTINAIAAAAKSINIVAAKPLNLIEYLFSLPCMLATQRNSTAQ
jgi:hypothetical protein